MRAGQCRSGLYSHPMPMAGTSEVLVIVAGRKDASGKKTVYPHSIMFSAATCALKEAKAKDDGSYYQCLLSCLSLAFSIEAYFNFLGEQIISNWHSEHEKLPPKEKLKLLAKAVDHELDYQSPEYGAFTRVFALRKVLVHGKAETIKGSWSTKLKGKGPGFALEAEWEKLTDPDAATAIYENCRGLITALHLASPLRGEPFGVHSHGFASVKYESAESDEN